MDTINVTYTFLFHSYKPDAVGRTIKVINPRTLTMTTNATGKEVSQETQIHRDETSCEAKTM
jgi:hypothetical protein